MKSQIAKEKQEELKERVQQKEEELRANEEKEQQLLSSVNTMENELSLKKSNLQEAQNYQSEEKGKYSEAKFKLETQKSKLSQEAEKIKSDFEQAITNKENAQNNINKLKEKKQDLENERDDAEESWNASEYDLHRRQGGECEVGGIMYCGRGTAPEYRSKLKGIEKIEDLLPTAKDKLNSCEEKLNELKEKRDKLYEKGEKLKNLEEQLENRKNETEQKTNQSTQELETEISNLQNDLEQERNHLTEAQSEHYTLQSEISSLQSESFTAEQEVEIATNEEEIEKQNNTFSNEVEQNNVIQDSNLSPNDLGNSNVGLRYDPSFFNYDYNSPNSSAITAAPLSQNDLEQLSDLLALEEIEKMLSNKLQSNLQPSLQSGGNKDSENNSGSSIQKNTKNTDSRSVVEDLIIGGIKTITELADESKNLNIPKIKIATNIVDNVNEALSKGNSAKDIVTNTMTGVATDSIMDKMMDGAIHLYPPAKYVLIASDFINKHEKVMIENLEKNKTNLGAGNNSIVNELRDGIEEAQGLIKLGSLPAKIVDSVKENLLSPIIKPLVKKTVEVTGNAMYKMGEGMVEEEEMENAMNGISKMK